ncbi:MAG: hypothetical protein A3F68_12570 [Acidobacteria bacterium RIFCSPLOWO2_12_FULL_54_10]|nr:MAG: hypothetical protein A3F68_12570 [Acidobacteria bacterium RIFCSPLOWO2_12_FULL_54_10]
MKNILAGLILISAVMAGCGGSSRTPEAAAQVNGKAILRADVERQFTLRTQDMPEKPQGDAATLARLEILREMIVEEIMLQKAEDLQLAPTDTELEAEFKLLRGESTDEEFQKTMTERGWTEMDLRNEMRRNLSMQKLVQSQLSAKVQVTPEEMSKFYEENKARFNVAEMEYRLAHIIVTPNPEMPVTNLRNDKAKTADEATKKIQMIVDRVKAGDDFQQLAREYSEDPQTAGQGGDLGFLPVSAVDQYLPRVRQELEKMKVGDTTQVIQTSGGYMVLKLVARRDPGQLELDNPEVDQTIRQELGNRKQQLLSTAYSEYLRNQADVQNYLAEDEVNRFQLAK